VLAQALEAMRAEINAAADRDDAKQVKQVAQDAAAVADLLLKWSQQQPQRVPPAEVLTVRVWHAWSLQQAGQTKEALAGYDACGQTAASRPSAGSVMPLEARLGRAECLLTLGDPAAALPLFTEVLQAAPERSPNWWRALSGSLACHTRLEHEPRQIIQSIHQQRTIDAKLGGPQSQRALEAIEKANLARVR
jgi:hypothetical protein